MSENVNNELHELRLIVQKNAVAKYTVTDADRDRALVLADTLLAALGRRTIDDDTLRRMADELNRTGTMCRETARTMHGPVVGLRAIAYMHGRADAFDTFARQLRELVDLPF